MGGGKKYAEYIVKISFPDTERLDLEKNIFDLFIVDGASNVQCAGEVVETVLNQVHTIHGAEHVLTLLFDNILNIHKIKVIDLCDTSYIFFYN